MPRFWQPTLFNRKARTKTTTFFSFGKQGTSARHVKRHSTGVRRTSQKYLPGGDLFSIRKGVAKRRGLL